MLEGVAGQEFIRRLQDQFIDPLKACLAARLGHSGYSDCCLRLTPAGATFFVRQNDQRLELTSPQQESGRLKALLDRCYQNSKPRIRVELDPRLLLIRQVRLPLAAKRNLQDVLGYEMDRLSPFESDEVYYHFTPLESNDKGGWMTGRLIVAQKQRLDPWYRLLAQLGMPVDHVTLIDDSDPLTLKPRQNGRSSSGSRLNILLWAGIGLLILAASGSAVWQQRQIAIDLQQNMQAARDGATQSMRLQERVTQRREAVGMVSTQRQDYLAMSDLLLELTQLIPPGSWLRRVSLSSGQVAVTGQSDQASELITLLERSPLFEAVRFRSPVVRDRRTGKENFDLTLELTREGGE